MSPAAASPPAEPPAKPTPQPPAFRRAVTFPRLLEQSAFEPPAELALVGDPQPGVHFAQADALGDGGLDGISLLVGAGGLAHAGHFGEEDIQAFHLPTPWAGLGTAGSIRVAVPSEVLRVGLLPVLR